ncbi:shwachman-Bodian-diamond syndrome protein [Acephala macrosclerotiorum]|nr:shwachman-Bodian-diamond syndrome protein [Acephala macrosclerotiorum]
MARGEAKQVKAHYQGKDEDFVVFVDDLPQAQKWKTDKSIPLAHFVSSFKIFITHKHGAQGPFDGASKAALENEFDTTNEDDIIKQILEKGTLQESEFKERSSTKNDSMGSQAGH